MENYYQRNMDQFECNVPGGVCYNQLLDLIFTEESSAPTEPVTLEEAKNFCKIDFDDDDNLITSLIVAARQACEAYTNVGFIYRELTAVIDNGNGGSYLPYGPVNDIVSSTDVDGGNIDINVAGVKWKQVLTPRSRRMNITYNAGYEVLPENLKTALLNEIMFLYDNRSQSNEGVSPITQLLLNPHQRIW